MLAKNQVSARINSRVGDWRLIGAIRFGDDAHAPVDGDDYNVCLLFCFPYIFLQSLQIVLIRVGITRGGDSGRNSSAAKCVCARIGDTLDLLFPAA